jgi:hypothetical protein
MPVTSTNLLSLESKKNATLSPASALLLTSTRWPPLPTSTIESLVFERPVSKEVRK